MNSSPASIQVVVRLRPMNEQEKAEGTLPVISASTSNKTVSVIKGVGVKQARSSFQFNNVFTSFSSQPEIFSETLNPVIKNILKGYETCVCAYGQTGTGKTHTMEGGLDNSDEYGIIPRSTQALFSAIEKPEIISSQISCSYLEIYNEELRDLLDPVEKKKMYILDTGKGVQCRGLTQQVVTTTKDVISLMRKAAQSRRVGETRMNRHSSRSHCIFTLAVNTSRKLPDGSVLETRGKLHMVDLAGSESAKTSEVKDSSAQDQAARVKERRNINKSLLTLGRVITSLKEQSSDSSPSKKKPTQIPYRDSKLTRILQEALGGYCKTIIIATISPSILNLQESLQTLHYAQAANAIQNKAPTASSYLSLVGSSGPQINESNEITADENGGYTIERWQEMEIRMEHMRHEVEEARQVLARHYLQEKELSDRAEAAEGRCQLLEGNLENSLQELTQNKSELKLERRCKNMIEEELCQTKLKLKQTAALLKATQETEIALSSEATALIQTLYQSIAYSNSLYDSMKRNREEKVLTRKSTCKFHDTVMSLLKKVLTKLEEFGKNQDENKRVLVESLTNDNLERNDAIDTAQNLVSDIISTVTILSNTLQDSLSTDTIPNAETAKTNIQILVDEIRNDAIEGDASLSKSCSEARSQLQLFSKLLDEHKFYQEQATEKSQLQIEKVLSDAESQVKNMLQHAETAIGKTKQHSAELRDTLHSILCEWKALDLKATVHTRDIADSQLSSLNDTSALLESGMQRRVVVSEELSSQRVFLKAKRKSQFAEVESQSKIILNQKAQLEASKKHHALLCQNFLDNVVKGVQNLVSEQLKVVVADSEARAGEILHSNKELFSRTEELKLGCANIYEDLDSSNAKLLHEEHIMKATDESILEKLKAGHDAFSDLHNCANDLYTKQEEIASTAKEKVHSLESIDMKLGDVCRNLSNDGNLSLKHMENSVRDVANESITLLASKGLDTLVLSRNEIIPAALQNIVQIEKPRDQVIKDISKGLDIILHKNQDGVDHLNQIVKKQLGKIKQANVEIEETGNEFRVKTCGYHKSQSNKKFRDIVTMIGWNEEFANSLLVSNKQNINDACMEMTSFGRDVIEMNVQVPVTPERQELKYSETLTSTPEESVIFQTCRVK